MSISKVDACYSNGDLRELARRVLPRMVFDYLDGGAGREQTLRENSAALARIKLVNSAPVSVASRRADITLFGAMQSLPLIVGPVGLSSAFHREGEVAMAKAASLLGIPYVLPTGSSVTLPKLQATCTGRKWFQLYVPPDRDLMYRWIDLAEKSGYDALEVTVDTAVPGRRIRDMRNGFSMPFNWTARKLLDVASRPQWALQMARSGMPQLVLWDEIDNTKSSKTISERNQSFVDQAVDWSVLASIRSRWSRPLIVKGIGDPRQAVRAVENGMDAIVLSNHGGRQLDGGIATVDLLPEVAAAVQKRIPILIDGGFRTGEDVFKALALGATAVQLGRAVAYGLAGGGLLGAVKALELIRDEFDVAMALCGVTDVSEISSDLVRRT